MKKVLFCVTLLLSTLLLTSCKVNWFGSRYDVPWYFVVIPVLTIFVIAYICIVTKTYVCPDCKTEFKPKWYQFSVCLHFNGRRFVKCPKCGKKGYFKRK